MKIAVLGSTGFVGSAVTQTLESNRHVVVRIPTPRILCHTAEQCMEYPRRHPERVSRLARELRGADSIVIASGDPDASSQDVPKLLGANSAIPALVAAAASLAGIHRVVHVSTAAVQGRKPVLDETDDLRPFSPYSWSKAVGEEALRAWLPAEGVSYRPPSVHAPDRRVTVALTRLASSRLSTVAGDGTAPTPQALIENVASAVVFLATCPSTPPSIVIHPWEGVTTASLLRQLGDKDPRHVPTGLARVLVRASRLVGKCSGRVAANARRLEMCWFGQTQGPSWLVAAGWSPPCAWSQLVPRLGGRGVRASTAVSTETNSLATNGRLLYGTTVGSSTLNFLNGQLAYFKELGWDVHAVSSPDSDFRRAISREGVVAHEIPMEREICPWRDAIALWRWIRLLRRLRPEIMNVGTPKAALLGLIAGWIVRVPMRIYTVRGLRYQSETGAKRRLLMVMERLTLRCATHAVAVSNSVREQMAEDGLHIRPIALIGDGSSNGVDRRVSDQSSRSRRELGIDSSAFIVGFVGRLHPAKGAAVLTEALNLLSDEIPELHLLVIGASESDEANDALVTTRVPVRRTGWVEDPLTYYPLMDVLCLPTFREGFPNVVLEAGAARVPAVSTTATGAVDSILHGHTGLLVEPGDVSALASALHRLHAEPTLRYAMGENARLWVEQRFPRERIWRGLASFYSGDNAEDLVVADPPHLTRATAVRYRGARPRASRMESAVGVSGSSASCS